MVNQFEINDRHELLSVFEGVSKSFNAVKLDIKSREVSIQEKVTGFKRECDKDPLAKSNLPKDNALRLLVADSLGQFKSQMDGWISNVKKYDSNTEFRDKHGDSLLVFVYGKVKSGKSSLGNYIAYGSSVPDDKTRATCKPKPHYFLETNTGNNEVMTDERMRQAQYFGVGETETTSSIQGFTLPGLTWIDSPGVHSMTPANGVLAKNYAGSADLIVFLSNSSSPGRRSDLDEITSLLEQSKPLVVLLTHSDTTEVDVNDDGEVIQQLSMKCEKDRIDQITYVQNELNELIKQAPEHSNKLLDMRVYPISTKYAEVGLPMDTRWEESGIANFAQRIAGIAHSHGLAMKRATPLLNLLSFCIILEQSSIELNKSICKMAQELQSQRRQLQADADHILTNMRAQFSSQIERLANKHVMNDAEFSKACNDALLDSLKEHTETLVKKLGERLETVSAATSLPFGKLDLPGFSNKTETVHYQSSINSKRGKAIGAGLLGLGATLAAAALTGGASLVVQLGAAAAVVASGYVGDKIGGKVGEQFDGQENMTVAVGDNRHEVTIASRQKLVGFAETQLKAVCVQLDHICFAETENWLTQVSEALADLTKELSQQQLAITTELSGIK
jgi:hypothetical protein